MSSTVTKLDYLSDEELDSIIDFNGSDLFKAFGKYANNTLKESQVINNNLLVREGQTEQMDNLVLNDIKKAALKYSGMIFFVKLIANARKEKIIRANKNKA